MNHRERVLAALQHREPDRVPMDLGGTTDSTIVAAGYPRLRAALGLGPNVTRMQDVVQQTAMIDEDVRVALGVDTRPILPLPRRWRRDVLPDGSPADLPAAFRPERLPDGSQVARDEGGTVMLKMPAGGHYFDPVHVPLADATSSKEIEKHLRAIETYDAPDYLDERYEALAEQGRALREETDYLLVGFFGGHIFQAGQALRGWEQFPVDLLVSPGFAEALMDQLAEANLRRFARFAATVGRWVDVVQFEDDLGMQDRPLVRPSLYRQRVKPYHEKLFRFAKAQCDALILLHSDGAIAPLIPDLIEMGVDAINPVQVSAAGMEPRELKRAFGDEIAFWGAGCESQRVLPFGSPQEVADEVKRRIDELAPGGGWVFAPIHSHVVD
jgi:uroporphyrinogen decarboxylase